MSVLRKMEPLKFIPILSLMQERCDRKIRVVESGLMTHLQFLEFNMSFT